MISASQLDRIARCRESDNLPQHRSEDTRDSARGTSLHWFAENARKLGREAALEELPDEHRAAAEGLSEFALRGDVSREIAFAWSPATRKAHRIGQGIGRRYEEAGALPTDVVGTFDMVGVEDGATAYVADLKTGWGWIPPAEFNWQIRFGAMCVARAHGLDAAKVQIVRDTSDGRPFIQTHVMDGFALDDFEEELYQLVTDQEHHETRAGPWCKYCNAWGACPGKGRIASLLAKPPADEPKALTPDNFPDVWRKAKQAEEVLTQVKGVLREYVRTFGAVPIGDGKVVAEVVVPKEAVVPDLAVEIVRDVYGPEFADAATETKVSISKSSITKALREAKKTEAITGTLKSHQDQVFGAMRAGGGLKDSGYKKVDEVDASKVADSAD